MEPRRRTAAVLIAIAAVLLGTMMTEARSISLAARANAAWLRVLTPISSARDLECGFASSQLLKDEGVNLNAETGYCGTDRAWARLAVYAGAPDIAVRVMQPGRCSWDDTSLDYFRGSAYIQQAEFEEARHVWWDAGPHYCLTRLGRHLEAEMKLIQAIEIYHRVMELHPKQSSDLRNMARAYRALGEDANAEAVLLTALALDQKDPDVLYALADVAWHQQQYDRAEERFIQALSLGEPRFQAFVALAFLALREDRAVDAYEWCSQASQTLSEDHELLCKGQLNYAEGNYDAAVDLLENPERVFGHVHDAAFWLGLALLRAGDNKAAERILESQVDQLNLNQLKQLGQAYVEVGNRTAAARAYEAALLRRPNDLTLRLALERLHEDSGH